MTAASDEQDRKDMACLTAGQDSALDELMGRHAERLYHYLLRLLQNETEAAHARSGAGRKASAPGIWRSVGSALPSLPGRRRIPHASSWAASSDSFSRLRTRPSRTEVQDTRCGVSDAREDLNSSE